MLAVLDRQQRLLKTQLSLTSLLGALLDPLVIVLTLLACEASYRQAFDAPYIVLVLIVFSLTFPGVSRFHDATGKLVRDVLLYWLALAAILLFFGYASGYLRVFPQPVILTWLATTPVALVATHLGQGRLAAVMSMQGTCAQPSSPAPPSMALSRPRDPARSLLGTRLVGFFDDRQGAPGRTAAGGGVLASFANWRPSSGKPHDLIYVTPPMATQPRIMALLDDLRDTTASIYFVPDLFADLIRPHRQHQRHAGGGCPRDASPAWMADCRQLRRAVTADPGPDFAPDASDRDRVNGARRSGPVQATAVWGRWHKPGSCSAR